MTQQQMIEEETLKLLTTGKAYSLSEIRTHLAKKGLKLKESSTLIRTTLSSMASSGQIHRAQRGVYCINTARQESSSEFITLLPEANRSTVLAVNILENGHINLNGKLNAQIISRDITVQFSNTFRQIRLIPNGKNAHRFTKIGTTKNSTICQELRRHRIQLPAHYEIIAEPNSPNYIGKLTPNT